MQLLNQTHLVTCRFWSVRFDGRVTPHCSVLRRPFARVLFEQPQSVNAKGLCPSADCFSSNTLFSVSAGTEHRAGKKTEVNRTLIDEVPRSILSFLVEPNCLLKTRTSESHISGRILASSSVPFSKSRHTCRRHGRFYQLFVAGKLAHLFL